MKKKFIILIISIFLILGIGLFYHYNKVYLKEKEAEKKIVQKKLLIKNIKQNYNQFVKVNRDTNLYSLASGKFIKSGQCSKNNEFELAELVQDDNEYFKIKDTDYYIKYTDVIPLNSMQNSSIRYDNFIPFDYDIIIKPNTKITDGDNNFLMIDSEIKVPLLIKEIDKYGFKYLNRLYYVDKTNATLEKKEKTKKQTATKVLTLLYHFIYDPNEKACTQAICQTLEQFESHLKYFKENNFFVMRLEELEMYLEGKINVPQNSIVLTIDDGHISEKAIRLLEQYETYATIFIITGHFEKFDKFSSPYLDTESHTNAMHKQYSCKGMGNQGGGILCLDEEKAIADLKLSQEKLGGSQYFSYPFFDYNERAIEIVKKAGFKLAFIGQANTNGFSKPGTNKYKVPRKTVFANTDIAELKKILNS